MMVSVAQLVEHQVVVLRVVGSIPTTHPSFSKEFIDSLENIEKIDTFNNVLEILLLVIGMWRNW